MHPLLVLLMAFLGIAMGIGLYMLPTIIAIIRQSHQTLLILILNVLFGWTVIGWFILLAMSLFSSRQSEWSEWEV